MAKTVEVRAEKDYLEKISSSRKLSSAISELVWNALDADATSVDIDYQNNGLDNIDTITVVDNGPKGMPYDRALEAFAKLGGSWKKTAVRTDVEKRSLHGKEGAGRFRAFALGDHVQWHSVYTRPNGGKAAYTVTGKKEQTSRFVIEDPQPSTEQFGTTVTISNSSHRFDSLHKPEIVQDLAEELALYLRNYPHVVVTYGGRPVDPKSVIERQEDWKLRVGSDTAKLTVIEPGFRVGLAKLPN